MLVPMGLLWNISHGQAWNTDFHFRGCLGPEGWTRKSADVPACLIFYFSGIVSLYLFSPPTLALYLQWNPLCLFLLNIPVKVGNHFEVLFSSTPNFFFLEVLLIRKGPVMVFTCLYGTVIFFLYSVSTVSFFGMRSHTCM